jgi:hypothetical protein
MRSARLFVCLVALLATVGCGSVFRVKRAGKKVSGIPFYVKTAKCLQSSVYLAPYYRLILQSDDSAIKSETVNLSEKICAGFDRSSPRTSKDGRANRCHSPRRMGNTQDAC